MQAVIADDAGSPLKRQEQPLVTIIVPAWNGADTLPDCLNSIFSSNYQNLDVIVVDNASTDGTWTLLAQNFPKAKAIHNRRNLGFAGAINRANSLVNGVYVLWLNQDAVLPPEWIASLVRTFENNPRLGMGSSIVIYSKPENVVWSAGGRVDGLTGLAWDSGKGEHPSTMSPLTNPDYVAGCASIVRRQALNNVGGLDPNYFMYFEDADVGLRLKSAGWELTILGGPAVLHGGLRETSNAENLERKLFFFVRSNVRFIVKNWPYSRMIIALAACLGFYLLFAILKGPSRYIPPILRAAAWNLLNLKSTLIQRFPNRSFVIPFRLKSVSRFLYRMARRPELFPY